MSDDLQKSEDMSSLNPKEWLNLSWNYFQQHAQQRISYFNFFVVFSTILTAALVSTFQSNFQAPFLGIAIGLVESFVAFIFLKIDTRNRFLTQNAENVIQRIEADYDKTGNKSYNLFTNEELETQKLKLKNKKMFFLYRHLTHGDSYKIIYITFFFIGIVMVLGSIFVGIKETIKQDNSPTKQYYYKIQIGCRGEHKNSFEFR